MGGRLATAIIGLLSIRFATTYLSPEEFGQLALLLMVQALCGLFFINPVGQHINRHTHAWWDAGTLRSRLSQYGYYIFLVSIIGTLVMFFIDSTSIEHALWAAGAIFLNVLLGTWNATYIPILNMLGLRGASVLWTVLTSASGLMASVTLMQWYPVATAWFFGLTFGMAVGVIGSGMRFRGESIRSGHKQCSESFLDKKTVIAYCLPLAVATGFMWLQLSGYRFVVESYWGLAQLGYITVGLTLAAQVWAVCESLAMQFLYPYFFKSISDNKYASGKQALSDLLNVLGPLYLVLAGVTVIAAPLLIFLLVDEKFSNALLFVMMGGSIECCRALANVFGNAAQVTRKTKSLALPYAAGAFVLFTLLFVAGINQADTIWVGVALVSGALVMLAVMIFSMYKQVAFVLELKTWLIGFLGMVTLCVSSYLFGKLNDWVEAIESLGLVAIAAILLTFLILRKNESLKRLLQVRLSGESVNDNC